MIHIDETLCNGCGVCTDSCPVAAIHVVDEKAHIDGNLCTDCGICISVCPFNAIVQEPSDDQGKPEPRFSGRHRNFTVFRRGRHRRGRRR